MRHPILTVQINDEADVVLVRQRAKQLAEQFKFDLIEQTRFATAVSELARNAFQYAGGGKAEFSYDEAKPTLYVRVSDRGKGIATLASILDGSYRSTTGMGVGLRGAQRLTDEFDIQTGPAGTAILLGKRVAAGKQIPAEQLANIVQQLLAQPVEASAIIEARLRNFELLQTLDALQTRQSEIERLNRELEETNRGVLALYSELDEKAESLKQASELKSRFLSQMSHELRTPLNSIVMMSRLIKDEAGGATEVAKQATFVQRAAEGLLELVNDLLDLAKIESGRVEVTPREVSVSSLWAALRGMFRPLVSDLPVELVFSPTDDIPDLVTDEAKLAQILRNLISNAIKFTARGYVRVAVEMHDPESVLFSVYDTGIGVPPEHQQVLFTEFVQLSEAAGYKQKGTGLGLALCRRFVEMLGGSIWCESTPGEGSTFSFIIPLRYRNEAVGRIAPQYGARSGPLGTGGPATMPP